MSNKREATFGPGEVGPNTGSPKKEKPMKLSDVWSFGREEMPLREKLRRSRERLEFRAARLVPQRIAYWVFVQLGVDAIRPDEVVPEVEYMTVLSRIPGGPR